MSATRLLETVLHLSERIGPRASDSLAERRAAEYAAERFRALGLDAALETFLSGSHRAVRSSLRIYGDAADIPSLPQQFSSGGTVEGDIVFLEQTLNVKDRLTGKIGLYIPSGSHRHKIDFVQAARARGLAGLIVVSPYMDHVLTKVLRYPELDGLPIVGVSWRDANRVRRSEGKKARLVVETEGPERAESTSAVATIPGRGAGWLAVTAHLDTAPFAPGALDNASGVATLLELAARFKNADLPATLVFSASGSEEYGCLDGVGAGAQALYERRADRLETCLGHVEIDDVGNVLGDLSLAVGGPRPFLDRVTGGSADLDARLIRELIMGCDHGAAAQRGIPYLWFSDCRDLPRPCYHSPEDTKEFFDADRAAGYLDTMEGVIRRLAAAPLSPYVREADCLIRPVRFSDHAACLDVTRQAFGPVSLDRMREDIFGAPLGGLPWHEHKNRGLASFFRAYPYQTIVAESEGEVVGYATWLLDESRRIAEIGNNAVRPDRQGRGIGKALQKEVRRRMEAEGFQRFQVTTLSVDRPAQAVYEKLGYRRFAESFHYLRDDSAGKPA